MKIEILFHSATTPKEIANVDDVYTKGGFVCIQLSDGMILKYPLLNIFSICHEHGKHMGTCRKSRKP